MFLIFAAYLIPLLHFYELAFSLFLIHMLLHIWHSIPFIHLFFREPDDTNDQQHPMETEQPEDVDYGDQQEMHEHSDSEAKNHQSGTHHHNYQPDEEQDQPELYQQPEADGGSRETAHHQIIIHRISTPLGQQISHDTPRVALQPLDDPNQENIPQHTVIQPQNLIITPAAGSPPRVSVHYLIPNTTSSSQVVYSPALQQQNVAGVTQSDTALLHEVLNELATRSLFNP